MTKNEIFEVLKENIYEIIPDLEEVDFTIEDSLRDLGANSIDRAEIIVSTLECINASLPMVKFGDAKNIREIIEVMAAGIIQNVNI